MMPGSVLAGRGLSRVRPREDLHGTGRDPRALSPCHGGRRGPVGAELQHRPARPRHTHLSPLSPAQTAAQGGGCGRVAARPDLGDPEVPPRPQKGRRTPSLWAGKAWRPSGNDGAKGHGTETRPRWTGCAARWDDAISRLDEPGGSTRRDRPGKNRQTDRQKRSKPRNPGARTDRAESRKAGGTDSFRTWNGANVSSLAKGVNPRHE